MMNNIVKEITKRTDEINELVMKMMDKNNMPMDNDNEKLIGCNITETSTKRKYIRTIAVNNKRNYKEALIENIENKSYEMDIDTKVIDGYLNINYFKGRVVENRDSKTGELYLGLVLACYLGSKKEGMYYKAKFNVARFNLVNGCLSPDRNNTVYWSVDNCESKHIKKPIDTKTNITKF